jgi:chitinase
METKLIVPLSYVKHSSSSRAPGSGFFTIERPGAWWVEVTGRDATVASMSVRWADGSTLPLSLTDRQHGTNFPVFAANYGFPDAGGPYPFTARSTIIRTAQKTLAVPRCVHGAGGVCQ